MTYKSWAVNSETVKDIGVDAMIFMRPYIDGIPFTEKAVNNGCQDEIGRYEYYNMENNISFRGGRVCNMSWFRRQSILEKKPIEKQYLGMRQRLGIAQAIMETPDVLILDEPMNGLDKHGVEEIRQLLLQLKEDKTILLASHNPADIELLCDDIYEMDDGILMHRG